jgi:beta-N-acetylhexosaminidase
MAGTGEDDPGKAAVRAIRAGADLILTHSTRHADLAFNGIVMALRDGSLSRGRALQSVRRILEASSRRCATATCAQDAEFPERLARAAVTEIGTVKRAPGETAVFVGAPGPLADSFPPERRISIPILPSEPQVESLAAAIAKTEGPVVAAIQNRGQARIVERAQSLEPKRSVTLVVLGSPYDALRIRADRTIFAYSFLPVAQRSALDVLEGKRCAPGRLPVDLGPLAKFGAGDAGCVSSGARGSR